MHAATLDNTHHSHCTLQRYTAHTTHPARCNTGQHTPLTLHAATLENTHHSPCTLHHRTTHTTHPARCNTRQHTPLYTMGLSKRGEHNTTQYKLNKDLPYSQPPLPSPLPRHCYTLSLGSRGASPLVLMHN
ncbi:hypothetical protein E2C01_018932 [Portunus trituberculatus]|uniref:Uncharacterized protein n=1 Tax=Portunus trituberculatus TaxID=210409 RepID=A0A5B7DXI9_PORTR|nr:hypothetical protein [Portunus trituberculatus]